MWVTAMDWMSRELIYQLKDQWFSDEIELLELMNNKKKVPYLPFWHVLPRDSIIKTITQNVRIMIPHAINSK